MILWYVAGPMRGRPRFNFDAFDSVTWTAREAGLEVISPAELSKGADTSDPDERYRTFYFRRSLMALIACSGIILLDGWEQSEGATLEVRIGIALGFSFKNQDLADIAAPVLESEGIV